MLRLRCLAVWVAFSIGSSAQAATPFCEIRVVDEATGRGVPLVELETVNHIPYVTDNAGRVAFAEPDVAGEEVFFFVRSHGYEVPMDGFGMSGVRVTPAPGRPATIQVKRTILAERLCRLTGQGLERDSRLLDYSPLREPSPNPGKVAGQDSVQSVLYRDRVYYFWGDTARMGYPLGLFRAAGATTSLPPVSNRSLEHGIPYDYFVDQKTGFARAMMPLPERPAGVVWFDGVCAVPDQHGTLTLVCHYSRRKGLAEELEQGIAVFNDEHEVFEVAKVLPLDEAWRRPSTHPISWSEGGVQWLLFGAPTPNVRVRATLEDVLRPENYEALTCLGDKESAQPAIQRDADGAPVWRWQRELPPVSSKEEHVWIASGTLAAKHARFCPANSEDEQENILLHNGTVRWNAYRDCWILLAGQLGGTSSYLGEVWYAESESPTGPFPRAVKVLSHNQQSFYNVCHHAFLDDERGKSVYFEGTYTSEFSGSTNKTPRYNYNQILYRLDLSQPALRQVAAKQSVPSSRDGEALPWIAVSGDRTHFVASDCGDRFTAWGVNYDHDRDGRLIEDYWMDEWETVTADFQEMKSLGVNVVRVHLQLGKFMNAADEPNSENLSRLQSLVSLAEQTGVYLDITGLGCYHKQDVPVWYDALSESERWDVQASFWRQVAGVCADSPAIFCYDLMNEPIVSGNDESDWLAGELGGKYFVQRITRTPGDRSPRQIAAAWVRQLTAAIRDVDARHLITVGVIPWAHTFPAAKPVFYTPETKDCLDFVSVHFYPKTGEVDRAVDALRIYDVGMPVVVEEIFPLACSVDDVVRFIDASQDVCDGWISFYWGKTIAEYEQESTIQAAVIGAWLKKFAALSCVGRCRARE